LWSIAAFFLKFLKVLSTGDLLVKNLDFSENMGNYVCKAQNVNGFDKAESFLYPLAPVCSNEILKKSKKNRKKIQKIRKNPKKIEKKIENLKKILWVVSRHAALVKTSILNKLKNI
jgi:hypothetical protein